MVIASCFTILLLLQLSVIVVFVCDSRQYAVLEVKLAAQAAISVSELNAFALPRQHSVSSNGAEFHHLTFCINYSSIPDFLVVTF